MRSYRKKLIMTGDMAGSPFQHYDLGYQTQGSTVVVKLEGNAANIRLLDSPNFALYQRGQPHHGFGGQAQASPVRLRVPSSGHWHVVIDLVGLGGQVRSSVYVEPPP